jgi:hypothetical protein
MKINYGEIKKYWNQDFNYIKLYNDNNLFMLDSPMLSSNIKNISRIKKIISQFKLKKISRPSPPISATFYKTNDIKIGDNNKFWIINNNKWQEIKHDVIKKQICINTNNKFKLINIPRIGEYNNIPLFITKIEKKKNITIEFIGIDKTIDALQKFI